MLSVKTFPGTEIKVTPESEAPIIPKATKYQGLCLSPVKKVSESAFREVKIDIKISIAKYAINTVIIKVEDIKLYNFFL